MAENNSKPNVENAFSRFETELRKNRVSPWLRRANFFSKTTTITALTGAALIAVGSSSAKAEIVFTEITGSDNPFNGVDVEFNSMPAFADIDGDGDLDAFIGEYGGNIYYYENQGSTSSPSFVGITGTDNPFNGVDVGLYSSPAFADIDGDGDLDAFIGEYEGNIYYYENQGGTSLPSFVEITGTGNPFNGVDVGWVSAPAFADIDDDGDLDAFIGEADENINYYENQGSTSSPSFVEITGTDNPFNGLDVGRHSAPAFADIDDDGDPDAFIGEWNGKIFYYENQGDASSPSFVEITGTDNPFNGVNVEFNSVPAFADIDGDGDLDAFIGKYYGITSFFSNDTPRAILQFSSAAYTVDEDGSTATITVSRTNQSVGEVSVDYTTSNGSAAAGEDYTAASGTLTWTNGDTDDKTFTVSITDDADAEGDETINLELSNPSGISDLGANSAAVLTIIDDDTAGDDDSSSGGGGGCFIETAKTPGRLKALGQKLRSFF